jgi:hypothetical protein
MAQLAAIRRQRRIEWRGPMGGLASLKKPG